VYSIDDPGAIRQIYGAGSAFTKASFYYAFGNPDKVHADLFSELDNRRHAVKRRRLASLYSMSSLINYESAIDEVNSELCEKLKVFAATQTPFQFPTWMQFYAFDVIGKITVSCSVTLVSLSLLIGLIFSLGWRNFRLPPKWIRLEWHPRCNP
jgi:hypothetical protein